MTPACLGGLWCRDYLAVAGEAPDTTTWVGWLQGSRFYCDLRQPASLPDLSRSRCLADLSRDDLRALASQQGFAGELTVADSVAHWERRYDYQPSSGFADRATLARTGDVLLETGAEQPYSEQWTRAKGRGTDRFGALLSEAGTGSRGVIVRVGAWLMYLRARSRPLPHGASLRAIIDAQSALHDARALLDFEISFGTLEDDGTWHILRSTLPYKAGRRWHVELPGPTRASVTISDVATDGEPVRRVWDVTDAD